MEETMATTRANRWAKIRRDTPLYVVFLVAAWQSYWHTVEVASHNGEANTAYIMALATDGMLVIGARVLMNRAMATATRYAAGVTFGLGVVATFAVNYLAATPTATGVFMATWPAVAMTSTSLVMHLSHMPKRSAKRTRKPATKPATGTGRGLRSVG
jgi:peptidoglycan/LPS O-acetylase OafA/YrhL